MAVVLGHHGVLLAVLLGYVCLASPSLRMMMETTMLTHLLVQLPTLAVLGFLAARALALHQTWRWPLWQAIHRGGAAGLIVAGFVMLIWMVPRVLDAALVSPYYEVGKFLTVPLAGAAVAVAWPHCPILARAVVHLEVVASALRFGWAYLESPQRLCSNYLLSDQARTGMALLFLGAIYGLVVIWPVLFGPVPRPRCYQRTASLD